MWRLFHRLFGWDYIRISFIYGNVIRRIQYTPNGKAYVSLYGEMELLESSHRNVVILTK
jgi:hypothetical protein